jgi:uncharacterized protein involved in outer membrane biogenesis
MMKTLFRWAFRLFILLIVLCVAAILLLDTIAREVVEHQLRDATGLEAKVGRINVGILHPEVTIENLTLYNQAQFGGSPLIEVPELHIVYDPDELRSRKLHCDLVRITLASVNLVDDKQGRRNFDAFVKYFTLPAPAPANSLVIPHATAKSWHSFRFTGVDTLNLSIGKVTYLHLKEPKQMDVLKLDVDHQIFSNVKTEQDLSSDLFVAVVKSNVNLMQSGNAQTWLQLFSPPPAPAPVKKP